MHSADDDLRLLRAFEPVVRFTRGEYFFPVSVERYLARAALWRNDPGGESVVERPAGTLGVGSLAAACGASEGLGWSLSGIASVDAGRATSRIPAKDRPARLEGASRLASVGLTARLVDTLNRASLLFRGSVAGGSAARSFLLQRDYLAVDRPTYYGRVVRDGPWVVCQYWLFYSFNNWRSAFGGVNEHEADWEQVTVYLDGADDLDPDGLQEPRWVVFSAHDETGDDLRRRWDDPDLSLVDRRHPVVFAGAGSHSGAYLPGDYLITVEPNVLGGVIAFARRLARIFTPWSSSAQADMGVPYIDYARGDGRAIGPGQPEGWHAVRIDDSTGWVRDFRGLWGHDTRDRLGGERGPSGPRYDRDGSVRRSWADPVAWAGMAKVAPNPAAERSLVGARARQVDERLAALAEEIDDCRRSLAVAAAGLPPGDPAVRALAAEEDRLLSLRMQQVRLADERSRMRLSDQPLPAHPHAHLRRRRTPYEPVAGRRGRFLSGWAVLSTPLILWAIGAVVSPFGAAATVTALTWLLLLLSVEGLVRGQFLAVVVRLLFAVTAIVVLLFIWADWRWVVTAVFFAAAVLVLVVNVRDAVRR